MRDFFSRAGEACAAGMPTREQKESRTSSHTSAVPGQVRTCFSSSGPGVQQAGHSHNSGDQTGGGRDFE